jgi:hypothetical protein
MCKTIYLPTVIWMTLKKHKSDFTGAKMMYLWKCMGKKQEEIALEIAKLEEP